jgi:hypothetical protein
MQEQRYRTRMTVQIIEADGALAEAAQRWVEIINPTR